MTEEKAKLSFHAFLPLFIGLGLASLLYTLTHWWAFWIIFPWIGFSITTGMYLRTILTGKRKLIGRKVAILMILPCLLLFVPIYNNENFQLEGVLLIILIGFFNKGFIHFAVAKIFGPLIWGRGFCGWACWTAAILDWLPIKAKKKSIPDSFKYLRFVSLAISFIIPVYLIFVLNYNVRENYLYKKEMIWMFTGNAIYYLLAIPLAFLYSDRRIFCKVLCPVSLVMIPASSLSLIKIKTDADKCIGCNRCTNVCSMDIDVMGYVKNNKAINHPECILCSDCQIVCPTGAI